MQVKTGSRSAVEHKAHNFPPSIMASQPWWCSMGYAAAQAVHMNGLLKETSNQPQAGISNAHDGSEVVLSENSRDEGEPENDTVPDVAAEAGSNEDAEQEKLSQSQTTCPVPSLMTEYIIPHTQLELGQSIACAPYPYSGPYYGNMMASYGAPPLAHPQFIGIPHTRMALPLEMTEEPVYVNAKQYHGILRRRQSRAKAELEKKLIKVRKPYLHESRHRHAMRRARGCGGRFLNTKKSDAKVEKTRNSGACNDKQGTSSLGSDDMPSCTLGISDPDFYRQEHTSVQGNCESRTYSSHIGSLQQHKGFHFNRGENGDCSGQQRNDILAKGCRTVTIQ